MARNDGMWRVVLLGLVVALALSGAVTALEIDGVAVGDNIQVSAALGADGVLTQPECCSIDPASCPLPLLCCFNRSSSCIGGGKHGEFCVTNTDCPDDGPENPGFCGHCDDDPKSQNETAITVAPWDPNLLIAAFNDEARRFPGESPPHRGVSFTISQDGGQTWTRLRRDLSSDACGPRQPCDPFDPVDGCFVAGHAFNRDDLCTSDFLQTNWLPGMTADPGTAAGGGKYLYILMYPVFLPTPESMLFARLDMTDAESVQRGWQTALVPSNPLIPGVDRGVIAADPDSENIYVHWTTTFILPESPELAGYTVQMTASQAAGCDFFNDPPAECPVDLPSSPVAVRLAYREAIAGFPQIGNSGMTGSSSAVGPDGEIHVVWNHSGGAVPAPAAYYDQLDQISYRRGDWDENGELMWNPPLPSAGATRCTVDVDCERGIVFNQPGVYPASCIPSIPGDCLHPGYRKMYSNVSDRSLNFNIVPYPSIAVDRTAVGVSGRRGYVYVAYVAEEPTGGKNNPVLCDVTRTVDTNIYVVRSRDGGATWSIPVRVPANLGDPEPVICGDQPGEDSVSCGHQSPMQFFPWIAVDGEGRVGVMFYDTTPDEGRCDENVKFRIQFAYSLDGGVTWEEPITVSDTVMETEEADTDSPGVFLGHYVGMAATTEPGPGVFHPLWTDLRKWPEWTRQNAPDLTPGDIFTATVALAMPVYSAGDYDRDGDVDTDDYGAMDPCEAAGTPLPAMCETLDLNRNNIIDKGDRKLFESMRTSGRATSTSGGDPSGLDAP